MRGEPCIADVQKYVTITALNDANIAPGLPWILRAPLRAVHNAGTLFIALVKTDPDIFLVQVSDSMFFGLARLETSLLTLRPSAESPRYPYASHDVVSGMVDWFQIDH